MAHIRFLLPLFIMACVPVSGTPDDNKAPEGRVDEDTAQSHEPDPSNPTDSGDADRTDTGT